MKSHFKKGFTLVELLVVIAILAILATVSIVGYSSFTKKANLSNDNTVIAELNRFVDAYKATDNEIYTVTDAQEVLDESGFDLSKIKTSSKGYHYAYDIVADEFSLLDDSFNLVEGYSVPSSVSVNLFAFVTSENERIAAEAKGYSTYLQATFDGSTLTESVTKGIDVGKVTNVSTINYVNTSSPQNVVIRTNTFDTSISIIGYVNPSNRDEGDIIKHYGYAGLVNVISCATASYDEYGIVGRLLANDDNCIAHINVKAGATVYQIVEKDGDDSFVTVDENATVYKNDGTKLEGAIDSRDGKANDDIFAVDANDDCAHANTHIVADGEYLYEVCDTCGYTLITVGNAKKSLSDGTNNVITPIEIYDVSQVEDASSGGDVKIKDNQEPISPAEKTDINSDIINTCQHTSWSYTENDDGKTHTKRCNICGISYKEVHTYVDDICVCGKSGTALVHNESELNDALLSANAIRFANDIDLTNTVTIPENKSISIDLNGYNLNFVNASGTQVLDHYVPAIYNLGTLEKIENGTIVIDGTWYAAIVNNGTIGTIGGTNSLTISTTITSGHTVDVCTIANYGTINTIEKVNATVCGSGVAGSINHSSTGLYNNTGATITLIKDSTIAGSSTNNVGVENCGIITTIESSTVSSYDVSTLSDNKGINNKGTITLIKDSKIKVYITGTNSGSASNNYAIYNQETLTKLQNCSVYGYSTIASALYNNAGTLGAIIDGYFYSSVGGTTSKYIEGGYYSVAPSLTIRQTNYVNQDCNVVHDDLTFTYHVVEDTTAYQTEVEELYCLKVIKNDNSYEMFASFADAMSYINSNPTTCSNATLVMTKDISEATIEFLMSTFVYQLKLDLNGHTLSSNASAQQFINLSKLYLTVKDSSEGQTGKIVAGHNTYWAVFVQGNARLILESGTITISNQCWSVVGFYGSGKLIVSGGTINTSSNAVNGGLTYTYAGTPSCEISSGTINNNAPMNPKWSRYGTCTFTITGGTFSSNMNPSSYVDTTNYDVTLENGKYVVTAKQQ